MAQTALTVQTISETSAALGLQDCDSTNGNKVANPNGDVFLVLKNTDGTNSATVTVTAQGTSVEIPGYGPMSKSDLAVTLAAGDEKIVGPFSSRAWNDSSGNLILAFSGTGAASVQVAPAKLIHY